MELNNLESGFDLDELLRGEAGGTDSIAKGVFAFKGVGRKRVNELDVRSIPSKCQKESKKSATKYHRKKVKQTETSLGKGGECQSLRYFTATIENSEGYFIGALRYENYLKMWSEAIRVMQDLQTENYSQIVDQVVNFVEKAKITAKEEICNLQLGENGANIRVVCQESLTLFKQQQQSSEIPTAALLTGVNVPDHSDFFKLLSKEIRSKGVSPHVASIQAKECGTSLRQLLKIVVGQLIGNSKGIKVKHDNDTDNEMNDSRDDSDGAENIDKPVKLKHFSSLTSLKLWYNNQYQSFSRNPNSTLVAKSKSPRKGGKTLTINDENTFDVERPPLVIILEDFESFTPKILQDFIRNLSLFSDNTYDLCGNTSFLQFVLILGVATTVDAVHRALPHSVTSLLAIEKFAAQPSIRLLSNLVERVLVKNPAIPFKVGGKTLKMLLEAFLFHDFSVKHFLMAYKCCLLEHFSQNAASILCCQTEEEIRNAIRGLTKKDLEVFRHLPSLKGLIAKDKQSSSVHEKEKKRGKGEDNVGYNGIGERIRSDNAFFKQYILSNVLETKMVTETFNIFIDALYAIVSDLPRQPLGKYYHSVYNLAMVEPIQRSHQYREAFQYLALSEKSGMLKQLKSFINSLKPFHDNKEAHVACATADRYIEELENLGKMISPTKDNSVPTASKSPQAPILNTTPKGKLDRFKLQEALLEQAKEKKRLNMNPFEELRRRILDFYHSTFARILTLNERNDDSPSFHPINRVFHEVFYFKESKRYNLDQDSEAAFVTERLQGAPRFALQKALQLPHTYLTSNLQLDVDGENHDPASLPDISIAYKLYLECGRYINLFDWLRCWITIVTNGSNENDSSTNNKQAKEEVDPRLQARFSRCVSELQFLGFIRPSKRKTDHVEKLTWN